MPKCLTCTSNGLFALNYHREKSILLTQSDLYGHEDVSSKKNTNPPMLCNSYQEWIQVLWLEGAKFGEGSWDLGGPQSGPGRSPGGGIRGRSPPEAPAIERF